MTTAPRTVPCGSATRPGCGKPIVWGLDPQGKAIPLDPSAPVYRVMRHDSGGRPLIERDRGAMVSHFATCPKANEFSKSQKRERPGSPPAAR